MDQDLEQEEVVKSVNQKSRLIILLIILVVLLSITILVLFLYLTDQELIIRGRLSKEMKIVPTNISSVNLSPTQSIIAPISKPVISGKIAYLKNKDLYLLEDNKSKQLTKGANISYFSWSEDARYIGWINREEYKRKNPTNGYEWLENYGVSISVIDLQTGKIQEVVSSQYVYNPDASIQEKFEAKIISGFDFINQTGTKIAYSRNGVWVKDLISGKEEKVLNDEFGAMSHGQQARSYSDILWNRKDNLLLKQDGYEYFDTVIYDLKNRRKIENNIGCKNNLWTKNGEKLISYWVDGPCGSDGGGIWITEVSNMQSVKILGREQKENDFKYDISVFTADISKDNQIAAVLGYVFESDPVKVETKLPVKENSLYLVDEKGNFKLIMKGEGVENGSLQKIHWLPDEKYISYLNCSYEEFIEQKDKCNLRMVSTNGKDLISLIDGISTYALSPI